MQQAALDRLEAGDTGIGADKSESKAALRKSLGAGLSGADDEDKNKNDTDADKEKSAKFRDAAKITARELSAIAQKVDPRVKSLIESPFYEFIYYRNEYMKVYDLEGELL